MTFNKTKILICFLGIFTKINASSHDLVESTLPEFGNVGISIVHDQVLPPMPNFDQCDPKVVCRLAMEYLECAEDYKRVLQSAFNARKSVSIESLSDFLENIARPENVTFLNFATRSAFSLPITLKRFLNLNLLALQGDDSSITCKLPSDVNFPNLTELAISRLGFDLNFDQFPKLRSIVLKNACITEASGSLLNDTEVSFIAAPLSLDKRALTLANLSQFNRIKTLSIDILDETCAENLAHLSGLEILHLSFVEQNTLQTLGKHMPQSITQITILPLTQNYTIQADCLHNALKSLSCLRCLVSFDLKASLLTSVASKDALKYLPNFPFLRLDYRL